MIVRDILFVSIQTIEHVRQDGAAFELFTVLHKSIQKKSKLLVNGHKGS